MGVKSTHDRVKPGVKMRDLRFAGLVSRDFLALFNKAIWLGARLSFAVALLFTYSILSYAQESPTFSVAGFEIVGDNPLSKSNTKKVLSEFTNRPIDIDELRSAATEIDKLLALKGYNFLRTSLPPQELENDIVRLEITRVSIASVNVIGNEYFSKQNIERSLPLVSQGRSPNTQRIASALLLAEDNPAKDVRVVFVKGAEPRTVDANITVQDQNPNEFFAWANNAGSRQTSRSRLGFQYHNRNLWGRDHQLALSYSVSPEDVDEVQQFGINYRAPIFTLRGMVNAFYSRSDADTGRVADVFDISGAGETFGLGYRQYLNKYQHYQHRLGVQVLDKLFDSDVLFGAENIGNDVRSRPVVVDYTGRWDSGRWLLNAVLSASSNLSGGQFNDDSSYEAARAGASRSWNKQNLTFRADYRIDTVWRARLLLFAQNSSDALIPGEKFGFGGSLGDLGPRGFLEREVTVDKGIKTSLEISRALSGNRFNIAGFIDFADGSQNNPQVGEVEDETLSSIGASLRWNIRRDMSLSVEYGYILDGVDQSFGDVGSDDGDDRWHISFRYFPRWPFSKHSGSGVGL